MEDSIYENHLLTLARGESIDHAQWPAIQPRILQRLALIVQTDIFPQLPKTSKKPKTSSPTTAWSSSPPAPETSTVTDPSSQQTTSSSQSTNKENAPPALKSEPATTGYSQIEILMESISKTLNTYFSQHPPHTIQRLAELIVAPKQHYRTLPSYLHAVDRVVHVTSGAHVFPLPPAIPDASSSAILSNGGSVDPLSVSWGNPASTPQNNLGSDESLGGALLTPISWLQPNKMNGTRSPLEGEVRTESTEMIDGPNGMGGIETVTVSVNGISSTRTDDADLRAEGGVTQGELLRQEQRAGVVPVAQLRPGGDVDGVGEDDESPHARGPDEIGPEDIGSQHKGSTDKGGPGVRMQGIDVEAAVGRKIELVPKLETSPTPATKEESVPASPKREAEEVLGADAKRIKSGDDAGADQSMSDTVSKDSEESEKKSGP
ncbi:hypothetical protein BJ878DRAFT_124912 [Calycina marina]|uniref:Protein phosphatase 4 core regulatory subunit R2 n=1 Tax=Calycina marina TaxID=1763456 RepID=A0A9P7Z1T1_9HELO|nr:hypothetical protein BJ878DRAFT_124912 [Calycina marina]